MDVWISNDFFFTFLLTMLIEKLSFGVAINSNIGIQTHHFTAPELFRCGVIEFDVVDDGSRDEVFESRLGPQVFGEMWIVYLEAIVDSDCFALLGLAWCRG